MNQFSVKFQLLAVIRQDSGELVFQQGSICRSAQDRVFSDISILQGSVVTRLRCGATFVISISIFFLVSTQVKRD